MAGYLKLTEGKVAAVVNTATILGIDPRRIRAVSPSPWEMRMLMPRGKVLAPTMGAVNVALQREEKRQAALALGGTGVKKKTVVKGS